MKPMEINKETQSNGDRTYRIGKDRDPYVSITTVLQHAPGKKEALAQWEKRHPDPDGYRALTGAVGDVAHYRCLQPLATRDLPPPEIPNDLDMDTVSEQAEIAHALWTGLDLEIEPLQTGSMLVEHNVWSEANRVAGTADLIATINGAEAVLDIKTSSQVRDSHKMQVAAYTQLARECRELELSGTGFVVRVCPRNDVLQPELVEVDVAKWWPRFLDVLDTYASNP